MGVLSHIRFRTRYESLIFPHSQRVSVSAPNSDQLISKIGARSTSVHGQAEEAVCSEGHLDSAGKSSHF
jgi:hypothetical protein